MILGKSPKDLVRDAKDPEEADRISDEIFSCPECTAEHGEALVVAAGGRSHCRVPKHYTGCHHKDVKVPVAPKPKKETWLLSISIIAIVAAILVIGMYIGAKYGSIIPLS